MLTKEVLSQQDVLKELTPEQITAIVTLSENDENAVIAEKTKRLAENLENDIKTVTGLDKNGGEKYFDYMKRVLSDYKTKAESGSNNEEIEKLQSTIADLETKLKNNAGDEDLKRQLQKATQDLSDSKSRVEQLETDLQKERTEAQTKLGEERKKLVNYEVSNLFNQALAGKKAKAGLNEETFKELVSVRTEKLLNSVTPEFIETDKGRVLQFRDNEGNIMTNPENLRNPFTASELILSKVGDLLHTDQQQNGTGTKPGQQNGGAVSVSGAKTQLEADELIRNQLHAQGKTTQDSDWNEAFNKIRDENEVHKLPTGYSGSAV